MSDVRPLSKAQHFAFALKLSLLGNKYELENPPPVRENVWREVVAGLAGLMDGRPKTPSEPGSGLETV